MKGFFKPLQFFTSILLLSSFALANEVSINVGMLNLPGEYKHEKYTDKYTNGTKIGSQSEQASKDLDINVMTVRINSMKPTGIKNLQYGAEFGFSSTANLELRKFENPASTNITSGIFENEDPYYDALSSYVTKKYEKTLDVNVLPLMGKVSYDLISNDVYSLNAGMGLGVYTYLMNRKEKTTYTCVKDSSPIKTGDVVISESNSNEVIIKPAVELNIAGNYNLTKNIFIGLNAGLVSIEKYIDKNVSTINRYTDYADSTKYDRAVQSETKTEIGGLGYNIGLNIGAKF